MAKEIMVDVINIANGVKRSMTVNSFKLNQKKFRLAEGQSLDGSAPEVKKKDVGPVASKPAPELPKGGFESGGVTHEVILGATSDEPKSNDFPPVTDATEGETEAPAPAPDLSPEGLLESLRAQYLEKSGKAADKRWNVARLTKEING